MKSKQLTIVFTTFVLILAVVLFPPYKMTILKEGAEPHDAIFFRSVYTFNPSGGLENGIMYQGEVSYALLFGIIATIIVAGITVYAIASKKGKRQGIPV